MARSERTHTPGPQGDIIEEEHLKLSGTLTFADGDDGDDRYYVDTRNLKRGQYIEITVRGYLTAWGEKSAQKGQREVTIGEIKFAGTSLHDLTILEQPVARNQLRGGGRVSPGQTSILTDALGGGTADDIGKRLSDELGVDVTVTLEGDTATAYPRASLTVGTSGDQRVAMHAETGEIVELDPGVLVPGPWKLPAPYPPGEVLGMLDPDTAAVACDGVVLAIPSIDFMGFKLVGGSAAPEPPPIIEDPPPSEDELRAQDDGGDDGPLAPDAPIEF